MYNPTWTYHKYKMGLQCQPFPCGDVFAYLALNWTDPALTTLLTLVLVVLVLVLPFLPWRPICHLTGFLVLGPHMWWIGRQQRMAAVAVDESAERVKTADPSAQIGSQIGPNRSSMSTDAALQLDMLLSAAVNPIFDQFSFDF